MASSEPRTIVAAYHSIHPQEPGVDAPDVIATPAALERDVHALAAGGYRFITAAELVAETNGSRPAGRTALLTFDDGWLDGLTVSAPLLASLGVRGTFFVCPGLWGNHDARMGDAGRILSANDAAALAAAGMDLGAHSLTHPDLRALDDDALHDQLAGSKRVVEQITGRPCLAFAYPFGLHDARVRRAVRDAGFVVAFAFEPGPWRQFAAPRVPAPLPDQYAA